MMIPSQSTYNDSISQPELSSSVVDGLRMMKTVPNSSSTTATKKQKLLLRLSNNQQQAPSSSSCCSEPQLKKRKLVAFDLTARMYVGRAQLTEKETEDMFWHSADTKHQAKKDALLYRKQHRDPSSSSSSSSTTTTTPYEETYNCALGLCSSSGRIPMEKVPLMAISTSSYRGLEPFLVRRMNETRLSNVRRILKAQSMLPTSLDADRQAALLCSVSKNLTRSSRRMGQLLAMADLAAAAASLMAPRAA